MAKVRLLKRMAGPEGNAGAGQIINVSAETAVDLVAGGYAEMAAPPVTEVETAVKRPPEQATGKRQRKPPSTRSRTRKKKEEAG